MKINGKILLLILLIINLNSFASKNELTDIFNTGNNAYKNADYSLAIEKYKSIINKGFVNYQVYFNLGNSYFKQKDYPSAILYFEKAYKLNAADEDIKQNLKLANKNITDKIEPVPEFFIKKLWLNLLLSFKIDTWAFLSLLFLFFGFALFIIFIVFKNTSIKKIVGSNSVNPMLPERRERPISTSEQRRRSAFESLRCELAHRRANYINTSPITSPPDRSESSNDSDGDESQTLTQPPAIIMPRPPPYSAIDKATVIEWLHYPLGYSDGKDHSKIIISKR